MQVGIRRTVEHDPSPRITHVTRNSVTVGVVWPNDHPVRTNRDWRTSPVEWIGVAVLGRTTEHINQARSSIRRSRRLCHYIFRPLYALFVHAHWHVPDFVLIARTADPIFRALVEDGEGAIMVHFGDSGIFGDLTWARHPSSRDLSCQVLIFNMVWMGTSMRPRRKGAVAECTRCHQKRADWNCGSGSSGFP